MNIDFVNDIIIEPSAGDGSFIPYIEKLTNNTLFLDIEARSSKIIQADFLTYNFTKVIDKFLNIHVVGNPPFNLIKQFIQRAYELKSLSISFILPASFKKDSLKKRFPSCYHLIFELDLTNKNDKNFFFNNVLTSVPTVFQI